VGSLLSFSRLNALPYRRLNLTEIIEEIILLLEHKIKEKNIIFKKNYSSNNAHISGDENRLKQVFMNLIMNSIEAVNTGGIISIESQKNTESSHIEISVIDNGCGIPEEIINNIFNPFFSTKVSKKNAGLGLSICQHIVELHNGIITCSSKPGKNTHFYVRLPLENKN